MKKLTKFLTVFLLALLGANLQPALAITYSSEYELFFNVQDNNFKWTADNARIYAQMGEGGAWYELSLFKDDWYSVKIPAGTYSQVQFLRRDKDNKDTWNYTGFKNLESGKNTWWANGSEWGYMIPIHGGTFYFDNSKTTWSEAALLVGRDNYTSVYPMSKIDNTQLYYYDMDAWAYATYITFVQCTGWGSGSWGSGNRTTCTKYTNTYTSIYNFNPSNWYLFTPASNTNNANISPDWKGQLSDFSKAQSVEIWVSTDGGSTYTKQNSSLSSYGGVKATYYYLSAYNATTKNTDKDIVANAQNAVITSTMSLTATAATGYTLKGYSNNTSTAPTTTDVSKAYTYTISGETTTRVYFALQSHNITYAENSDIASYTAQPTTGYYNNKITVTATASANHVITGASTNVAGVTPTFTSGQNTQTATVTFTMPASDVQLTWTTALGKVNLNFGAGANGSLGAKIGENAQPTGTQIDGGSVVDFTATPNPGYQVEGWYSDSGFDTKIDESKETTRQITANADVNVYVKFEPITYSITYKETHDVTHSNPNTYTIETETITFAPPTSNRTGYDFAGWSPATISKGSYGNQDVTANWTAHTYTVHFDANSTEGIAGSMEDQTGFVYDQNKTLTACNFTKKGYTFAGWATTAQGSVAYFNQDPVKNLTAEDKATVTLYAKWTPANFTLDLNTNKTNDMFNVQVNNQLTLTASATLNSQPYTLDLNHYNYSYKKGNDGDFTAIIEQTGTSTNWTPTEIGTYTIRVEYTDGTITGKTKDITVYVWNNYTIYVWDPTIYAKRVHIWNDDTKKSLYAWTDVNERMTDISSAWGNYWYSFTLQYPLYDAIKVHLEAATNSDGDAAQSKTYKFTKDNLPTDHQYLKVINKGDANWEWEEAAEPQAPVITITQKDVTVPATKIKVEIKISPKYSPLTDKSLKIDGQTYDVSEFDAINGGTKTIELNNLAESSEHTFVISATNALGTTKETQTITTLAKRPITFMIKVANELFGTQGWGPNGNPDGYVGINYWLADEVHHYEVLQKVEEAGGYYIYYYTFEDSPVSFYLCNVNVQDPSGDNRSANWNNATEDGCALVWEKKVDETYKNRVITTQDYCTTRYQLVYTNSSNYKTYSNAIEDKDETLSLFVAPGGTLQMMQYDPAKAEWKDASIFSVSGRPSTAGVYNLNLVNVTDFEHITEANLSDFTAYKGKYYIRTDAATGGWQEYLFADKDNAMTEFTPRRDKGEDYSYYWVKNVAKNGTVRVSACVGNEFNPDLANMLTYDDFVRRDGDHGYIDKLDGVGANVRFSYEPTTNEFKRAVIGGSSANNFLNVYSKDNNLYATSTCPESDLLSESKKTSAISRFNDVSDWVYEKVVYVKVEDENTASKVILQSVFNNQTNYLLGYEFDKTTPKQLEVLGMGTNAETYPIRITYDYKKNRLMASWEPGSMDISANQSINTDILFIQREDANGAIDDVDVAQITYTPEGITNEAKLTSLKNIIYVLEVTQKVMEGVAIDNQEYWITLPFDCRISDVFGVEDYVKLNANGDAISGTWGIMRYDGETRASHGWFLDDYSTFWRWMTRDEIMNAGEGYVVIFDKTNASSWPSINVDGENKQVKRLYFPSMNTGFTVSYSKDDSKVTYTNNPCTVKERGDQDSNWKVLGPKSYNNIDVNSDAEPNLTFYYTYNQANEKGKKYVEHNVTKEPTLKSFHSYMAQFGGDLTWKPFTKSDLNQAPLFSATEQTFKGGMLTIELVQNNEQLDRTFVNLHKNGTTGFDNNMELVSISENCAQISTISEGIEYAGTTLPLSTELVPLNVKVTANGTYDIALSESLNGLEVRLYDAFEQTTTPLDMMSATVTLNKGEYKDRFYLQLKQKSGETPTSFDGKIEQFNLPTDKTQKLLINGNIYLINGGRVYNVLGVEE